MISPVNSPLRPLSDSAPFPPPGGTAEASELSDDDRIKYTKVYGSDGDDTIFITQDNDAHYIISVNGQKKIIPMEKASNLWIDGKKGNDVIIFDQGYTDLINVVVLGGEGDDIIKGPSARNAVIRGGDGDDTVMCSYGSNFVDGGRGNDVLTGCCSKSFLDGGEGNDILHSGSKGDILFGGQGKDVIYGGVGDDIALDVEPGDMVDLGPGSNKIEYIIARLPSSSPGSPVQERTVSL